MVAVFDDGLEHGAVGIGPEELEPTGRIDDIHSKLPVRLFLGFNVAQVGVDPDRSQQR